jgi:hypothetical protein
MPNLQEAMVTEGIREQAAKLGYIVKQKGRRFRCKARLIPGKASWMPYYRR